MIAPASEPAAEVTQQQQKEKTTRKSPVETTPGRSRRTKTDDGFIGRRVEVLWDDVNWYPGTVKQYIAATDKHLIVYDDGDQKQHNLEEESSCGQLRWLGN